LLFPPLLNQQDAKNRNGKTLIFFKRRKKSQPSCALIAAIAERTAKRLRHNGAVVYFLARHLKDLFRFLLALQGHLVLLSFFPFSFEKSFLGERGEREEELTKFFNS
jgi:hypothetical protein